MLTPKQQRIFDFICHHIDEERMPPSYQEIAAYFGFSTVAAVKCHLDLIEKKGYIRRSGKARGIQILKPNRYTVIPIVGTIAAGEPSLAIDDVVGSLDENPALKPNGDKFALKVQGDSMVNAGILAGDLAIVQRNVSVVNGDIAAVVIDDHATLKRVYIRPDGVTLKAENPAYAPIELSSADFDIRLAGKYVGLVRDVV